MTRKKGRRFLGRTRLMLRWILVPLMTCWAVLAIHFSNLPEPWMRHVVALLFGVGTLAAYILLPNRARTTCGFLAAFGTVLVWWLLIPPSNDRDWEPEYSRLAHATFDGNRVSVHDIRAFEYRSEEDHDARWIDKTFDLDKLNAVDVTLTYWGGNTTIAHFMLSFSFGDEDHLVVSVETRRERGEVWSTIGGFFKQYELIMILGTERDLMRLRTNIRGEQLYLYRTNYTPAESRELLLDILRQVNHLYEEPTFYNTITHNCMTSLLPEFRDVRGGRGFDIRLILNGESDRMAYEAGTISNEHSFEETRRRAHVNPLVADDPADYSRSARPFLH